MKKRRNDERRYDLSKLVQKIKTNRRGICETCKNWKSWKGGDPQSETFGECTARICENGKPYISADVETCNRYSPNGKEENMISVEESILVFAARYAHHRSTGASLNVIHNIIAAWDDLSTTTQSQILRERKEATFNQDDWKRLDGLEVKEESNEV